jgi:serine/threonine protein kinase
MVIQATCPDPDVIRDLLNGTLPEAEQSELSSHFDLCPTCQQQFDAEANGPRFLGDVARLCSDSDWQQNTPTLDRLIQDMPQQLSDAADEASVATWSTEAVADFLDSSENADHIGRLGTYEIVDVIGRGGMGIVLRGIDSRLNRVVAIKVLAPELASNPNARRRFYREGQAAAAVSHDHVVTIHAVDDHERLPYLVMEFVAGESLEECIRRTGPLPLESVLRMGRQAALGLAAAHEVGLVHRDMKPANILLENGIQRVRITDFGLARATDDVSMTQTGTVSGTPLYMSPEQAGGESVDHRSDLFSLGSVFYAMCTGRPAFRAQTTLAVIKRVCEDTPRPIREVNPEIPQWLADIIDRLMAKQPSERIQSAAELAELLGNHLAHLQDPDNVPAPSGAGAKPARERRTLKSLILAVFLIGGVGLSITEAAGVTDIGKFLGIVLRLKTPEGTLVIEIEDPDVEVSVDGSEVVLSGITRNELRLKPGKYQYRATRNGKPAESDWVTIKRDGKTVVRVQQIPPEHSVEVTAETLNPPAPNSDDPFTQTVTARRMWALVSLFEQKEQPEAVTVYCSEITRRYPASEYAEPAADKLAELEQQGFVGVIPFEPAVERLWFLAEENEKNGRQDIAIMLCHEIVLSYSDSRWAARAQQKYEELKNTQKGAEGLSEVFWAYSLSFQEDGYAKLAKKMRQKIATEFPTTIIGQAMRILNQGNSGLTSKTPAAVRQRSGIVATTESPDTTANGSDGITLLSPVRVRRLVPD